MMNNQKGTAGIKVIFFIVILGMASLMVAAKIQQRQQVNIMMSQIASLGATVSKQSANASEIIGKYNRNYARYLYETGKLPSGLSYTDNAIRAANNAIIKANVDANGVVVMEVANLNANSCVKMATANWGDLRTTQFAGIGIGKAPDFGCLVSNSCKFNYIAAFSGTSDYPFSEERASIPCSLFEKANEPATVYLGYKL